MTRSTRAIAGFFLSFSEEEREKSGTLVTLKSSP